MITKSLSLLVCSLLLIASANAQTQCGSRTCPSENSCCSDSEMGAVCYDPLDHTCASDQLGGYTLCGSGFDACGPSCYSETDYFCCNGALMQKGQPCASTSAPTTAPPTTAAPTTPAPTTSAASSSSSSSDEGYYCSNADHELQGVYCENEDLCCGGNGIRPFCLPSNGTKQCCKWWIDGVACDLDETCGGSLGTGASSTAYCCAAGTSFCEAGLTGSNTCCDNSATCCTAYTTESWCCPSGSVCNSTTLGCTSSSDSDSDSDPGTAGATSAPTTAPPATASPTSAASSSSSSSEGFYCANLSPNVQGVYCESEDLCCGDGGLEPFCLPADGSKQCCQWWIAATACDLNATCGGSLGSGASSGAFCCSAGASFCEAGGTGSNLCCDDSSICCTSYSTDAWCCPSGTACNGSTYGCNSIDSSTSSSSSSSDSDAGAGTAAPATGASSSDLSSSSGSDEGYYCSNISPNVQGVYCESEDLCCGGGGMEPFCLPANGTKQCCQWWIAATACDQDETCGGSLGSGASSGAYCCAQGTSFCEAGGTGSNTCCDDSSICCTAYSTTAWCCPSGSSCNSTNYSCN